MGANAVLNTTLKKIYSFSRRLHLIDVTWLLHRPAGLDVSVAPVKSTEQDGYRITKVTRAELADLKVNGLINPQVGEFESADTQETTLVAAYHADRVVSFAWFASRSIDADRNYSRSSHLGTSIDLGDGSAFVFNAWTDQDHRGKRLMASIANWAIRNGASESNTLATMIDWTNEKSIRAFERLGMRRIGWIFRMGRGSWQITLVPSAARRIGMEVALDAPGVRLAVP